MAKKINLEHEEKILLRKNRKVIVTCTFVYRIIGIYENQGLYYNRSYNLFRKISGNESFVNDIINKHKF